MEAAQPQSDHWCYTCNKRVCVETQSSETDVVCRECHNGFVESIHPPAASASSPDGSSNSVLGSQFLQMLRIFSQADPPSSDAASEDDFLRIELDGWDNDAEEGWGEQEQEEEEDYGGRRNEGLLRRMTDLAANSRRGRNRILDWAEVLMVLEDSSVDLWNGYMGNREDYLDSAGFESLLQTMAEGDGAAKRGAPAAARSAVEGLRTVKVSGSEEEPCAICKEGLVEKTEMPCGHGYHRECIATWLATRNSCPVCRFELPTDDADYEEERRRRGSTSAAL